MFTVRAMFQLWVRRDVTSSRATAHWQGRFGTSFKIASSINLVQCVCIRRTVHKFAYTKIKKHVQMRNCQELCSSCETVVGREEGELSDPPRMSVRRAWVRFTAALVRSRQRRSCNFGKCVVLSEKWNGMPTKLLIKALMMKQSRFSDTMLWCDACMRARGIAGRHEKREFDREDEGSLIAMHYGYM